VVISVNQHNDGVDCGGNNSSTSGSGSDAAAVLGARSSLAEALRAAALHLDQAPSAGGFVSRSVRGVSLPVRRIAPHVYIGLTRERRRPQPLRIDGDLFLFVPHEYGTTPDELVTAVEELLREATETGMLQTGSGEAW
jgi:hypothetical protein